MNIIKRAKRRFERQASPRIRWRAAIQELSRCGPSPVDGGYLIFVHRDWAKEFERELAQSQVASA